MTQRPPRVLEEDIRRILDTAATRAETDRRAADIAETVEIIVKGFNAIDREDDRDSSAKYAGRFIATLYICEAAGLSGTAKAAAYAVAEYCARMTSPHIRTSAGYVRPEIGDLEQALCRVLGVKPKW